MFAFHAVFSLSEQSDPFFTEYISIMAAPNWFNRILFGAPPRAQESLQSQAANGNADAQFTLALRFSLKDDYINAAAWYLKAAQQDHSLAQFNLGIIHSKGQGVARDSVQACQWFTKAAEKGDPGAQYHLGIERHRNSLDESVDAARESRIEAYKWLRLATIQEYLGSEAAWDRIAMSMVQAEIDTANERVARHSNPMRTPGSNG